MSDLTAYLKGGKLHREDGLAIERDGRTKSWRINRKLHREDGPAIEWANGQKEWWRNDRLHREDGPAIERANGQREWWLKGNHYPVLEDWAHAVLKHQGKECTKQAIDELVKKALRPYMEEAL